jgi:hypothetical protein
VLTFFLYWCIFCSHSCASVVVILVLAGPSGWGGVGVLQGGAEKSTEAHQQHGPKERAGERCELTCCGRACDEMCETQGARVQYDIDLVPNWSGRAASGTVLLFISPLSVIRAYLLLSVIFMWSA